MSRYINFRGWDGEKRRMWSWDELRNTHPLGCLYSHGDGSWEVMQYTGLCDKNGMEVYEGDIVTDGFILPVYAVVVWNSEQAKYIMEVGGEFWGPLAPLKDYYVAGNVHENADLLASAVSE